MPRARLAAIHLHPVKSCRRVEVTSAVVGAYGLQGDREWQVQGPHGEMTTQRTFPALARVQPVLQPGGLRLRYDGMADLEVERPERVDSEGETLFGPVPLADAGDDAARWFEHILGTTCRLAAIAGGYHRRVVVGGDLFGQEVSLSDAAPVLVVNAASHRHLLRQATESFGIERFRPNLVVDGCRPWEEDGWRRVRIGSADVHVVMPWPRCAIPQIDQDSGQRHREPAVVLKRHRWCADAPGVPAGLRESVAGSTLFGVGASIGPPGTVIAIGDPVEIVQVGEPLHRLADSSPPSEVGT